MKSSFPVIKTILKNYLNNVVETKMDKLHALN